MFFEQPTPLNFDPALWRQIKQNFHKTSGFQESSSLIVLHRLHVPSHQSKVGQDPS